eukprot:6467345-Amphidinium_carterae.1
MTYPTRRQWTGRPESLDYLLNQESDVNDVAQIICSEGNGDYKRYRREGVVMLKFGTCRAEQAVVATEVLQHCAGSARGRTIRGYVTVFRKSWPSDITEVILYSNVPLPEACSGTVPGGLVAALSFFQTRGGIPPGHLSEATSIVDA